MLFVLTQISYTLNILVVSTCYTGHLTPTLAIIRKLFSRGHTADFLTSGHCCQAKIQNGLPNRVDCLDRGIIFLEEVDVNDPIQAIKQFREIAAENGTGLAFQEVNKRLSSKPGTYDVMIADWALLGATIASELHKIPVVTSYIGTLFLALQDDPNIQPRLSYVPEPFKFFGDFVEFLIAYVYHKTASGPAFNIVVEINKKFNMEPKIQNYGLTFLLPSSYFYAFSNLIHFGPPNVFTPSTIFMTEKTNVHHVGYFPEKDFYQKLDKKVEHFVKNSKTPVIYISLGTLFKTEVSKLEKIVSDLSIQREFSFIWSASDFCFEKLKSLELPENNLIIVNNVAQLTLLMEEKVLAFLSHAGKVFLIFFLKSCFVILLPRTHESHVNSLTLASQLLLRSSFLRWKLKQF